MGSTPETLHLRCQPWTGSFGIIQGLVRNVASRDIPRTYWISIYILSRPPLLPIIPGASSAYKVGRAWARCSEEKRTTCHSSVSNNRPSDKPHRLGFCHSTQMPILKGLRTAELWTFTRIILQGRNLCWRVSEEGEEWWLPVQQWLPKRKICPQRLNNYTFVLKVDCLNVYFPR